MERSSCPALMIVFGFQVSSPLPDLSAIKSVQRLSWAAGVGMLHLMQSSNEEIHKVYEKVR